MAYDARRPEAGNRPALFIDGYLNDRFKSGERPDYGYPSNHLPATNGATMKVENSFFASRKDK